MTNFISLQTFIERELERTYRVAIQALVTPWINAVLYIVVFGAVVGSRIPPFAGVTYIQFVLPGILMMNLIMSSFSQTSFSLYFMRFTKHIEELLVSPLSYLDMLVGHVASGVARGLMVGAGIYVIAVLFHAAALIHPGWFLFYALSVSVIFSLSGLLIGLWANNFEQISIVPTFVITPLMFLGGVFNSIHMLPEQWQWIVRLNPFFYFVDGIRYAMIGIRESNAAIGLSIIFILIIGLGTLVWYLFKIGWRIRS